MLDFEDDRAYFKNNKDNGISCRFNFGMKRNIVDGVDQGSMVFTTETSGRVNDDFNNFNNGIRVLFHGR